MVLGRRAENRNKMEHCHHWCNKYQGHLNILPVPRFCSFFLVVLFWCSSLFFQLFVFLQNIISLIHSTFYMFIYKEKKADSLLFIIFQYWLKKFTPNTKDLRIPGTDKISWSRFMCSCQTSVRNQGITTTLWHQKTLK